MEIKFETIFHGAVFLFFNRYATSPTCKELVELRNKFQTGKKTTSS